MRYRFGNKGIEDIEPIRDPQERVQKFIDDRSRSTKESVEVFGNNYEGELVQYEADMKAHTEALQAFREYKAQITDLYEETHWGRGEHPIDDSQYRQLFGLVQKRREVNHLTSISGHKQTYHYFDHGNYPPTPLDGWVLLARLSEEYSIGCGETETKYETTILKFKTDEEVKEFLESDPDIVPEKWADYDDYHIVVALKDGQRVTNVHNIVGAKLF